MLVFSKSILVKFIECILAGLAIVNIYNTLIVYIVSASFANSEKVIASMKTAGFFLFICLAIFALFYPIYWQMNEKKNKFISDSKHAFLIRVIRFWLTIMLSTYAFAKILGTQFGSSFVVDDSFVKELSGFQLTWFFFSYSYAFAVVIALTQLLGAVLLLFRKTVFIGVCVLLPVMINIVLIDVFYKISAGAELNAIFYTIALLYLLSLYWKQIKEALTNTSKRLPGIKSNVFIKLMLRIGAVGFSFIIIYYSSKSNPPDYLTGKWNIQSIIRGDDTIKADAWLYDNNAWTNAYFQNGRFTLNANPFVIIMKEAKQGQYHYDSASQILSLLIGTRQNVQHNFEFKVVEKNPEHMVWKGQHDSTSLQIELAKETR